MSKNKREEQESRPKKFRGRLDSSRLLKRIDRLEASENMTFHREVPEDASESSFTNAAHIEGYWPDIFIDSPIKKHIKRCARDRFFEAR